MPGSEVGTSERRHRPAFDTGPADTEAPAESGTPTPATDVSAAPPSPVPADAVVEAIRAKLADPALAGAAATEDLAGLQAFYAERSEPVWITPMGFTARAQGAIDEIGKADDWGLAAAAFTLPPAGDLTDQVDEQVDAEIKLALVVLKYARYARGGRVDPACLSDLLDLNRRSRTRRRSWSKSPLPTSPMPISAACIRSTTSSSACSRRCVKVRNPGEDGQKQEDERTRHPTHPCQHGALALDARGPRSLLRPGQRPGVHALRRQGRKDGPRRQDRGRSAPLTRRRSSPPTCGPSFSTPSGRCRRPSSGKTSCRTVRRRRRLVRRRQLDPDTSMA